MRVLAGVLGVIVFIGVVVVAWIGYWNLQKANTDQQYQVNTQSQQYQAGLISQEEDRVTAYNAATDPSQKALIKSQFCTTYADLTHPPQDLVNANYAICGGAQ